MAKEKISAHQYFFINPFTWCTLLIQNRGVSFPYLGKAIIITLLSLISAPIQMLEWLLVSIKKIYSPPIESPVFIIGHWRSGTTFLHYLMAKDEQFGFLTYYQSFLPNFSILGGNLLKKTVGPLIPKKRPQDNIEMSLALPTEEENPLSTFSSRSASHSFFFPDNESYYNKYILFQNKSRNEKRAWKRDYQQMLQKIALANQNKRLLIKNPHNTGRIKELLETYPNAKFIYLFRNPYDVIPSTELMYNKVIKSQYLKTYTGKQTKEKIFYYYDSILKKYCSDKIKLSENQLIEVQFEHFEQRPFEVLEKIYRQLELPFSDQSKLSMRAYINSRKNYKKNEHVLSTSEKEEIYNKCTLGFTMHSEYHR